MEKHPITSTIVIAIVAAFLGEFGSRGLDAMSNFIIHNGWCATGNDSCLFFFQFFVLVFIIAIAFAGDTFVKNQSSWAKVKISAWHPFSNDVLCGITIQNNSWSNLDDCVVELTGYEDERMTKLNMKSFDVLLKQRGDLPKKLLWRVNREPEDTTKIVRGKEANLMICFPIEKSDLVVVGKDMYFKVITNGLSIIDPFIEGWVYIRISAQVNNSPLPLRKIAIRIALENKNPVIKEIKEMSNWNYSFRKVLSS
jgi:hypothetical protein